MPVADFLYFRGGFWTAGGFTFCEGGTRYVRSTTGEFITLGNPTDVPTAEVTVKHTGIEKHPCHIGYPADVPTAEVTVTVTVTVKGTRSVKQILHLGNIADVPTADIIIKRTLISEQTNHIINVTCIPTADITISITGCGPVIHPHLYRTMYVTVS